METTTWEPNGPCLLQPEISLEPPSGEHERRTAHYKPNIWSYDYLESLVSDHKDLLCRAQVERLKEHFIYGFNQEITYASKLQIIDNIVKLGLSNLFEKELSEAFDDIASGLKVNTSFIDNVGTAALCFRLLRQHGYDVSHGLFTDFLDKEGAIKSRTSPNIKVLNELYEASHLAVEGESLLIRAGSFLGENLKHARHSSDKNITRQVVDPLKLPLHWRVQWFEVRHRIDEYDQLDVHRGPTLLQLAKLNFNMVQSTHQRDLRDLSKWWRNLGLMESMSFARDRLAESFLWTVGVASEPQYSSLRKCLTKVVTFILVIDDLYDVYGSLDELDCFTRAVHRWSWEETCHLPECMKNCFWALHHTTNEIASTIQNETGCHGLLPYLRTAWADFCKALLIEAQWYSKCHTPSLKEYLNSAWISSSGPLLSLVVFLSTRKNLTEQLMDDWSKLQGLVYYTSVIIRLCNDLGTTAAELERGDSPSSILCYMREVNETEEAARWRIKDMIANTWKSINGEYVKQIPMLMPSANLIINTARVSHFIYHNGDGFSVQDGDTKRQVKRILVEPVVL